jgi:DNA repair protein RecO (recombination protein O)
MLTTVTGLIIRTADVKESDRLVTIFTEETGVITAIAKGARSIKSRQMSATLQFCYGRYVLYQKNDFYWIKEAELLESFFDIRKRLEGLALASYLCEILSDVTVSEADRELLRLSLNSLYAIAKGQIPLSKIKAAFELRAAAILGFLPDVLACRECEKKDGDFYLDVMDGSLICADCRAEGEVAFDPREDDGHERHLLCILPEGAKIAVGYVIYSPLERIYAFRIGEEDMRFFASAAEHYLLNHLERSFKTLDFYKEVAPQQ